MKSVKILSISALTLFATHVLAGPVNVNTATADQLDQELNGVGPVIAERIIAYRAANGSFESAKDLMLVKGIGNKTLSKNAEFILLK